MTFIKKNWLVCLFIALLLLLLIMGGIVKGSSGKTPLQAFNDACINAINGTFAVLGKIVIVALTIVAVVIAFEVGGLLAAAVALAWFFVADAVGFFSAPPQPSGTIVNSPP